MAKIPTKKVKVQVRACQTLIFSAKLQHKVKAGQTLSWTFTFLVRNFSIFGELGLFSPLGGTNSILRTFLGGTSKKTHPVEHWYSHLYNPQQTNYSGYIALMIASIPMFLPTGYQILEKVEDGENIENAKST